MKNRQLIFYNFQNYFYQNFLKLVFKKSKIQFFGNSENIKRNSK